MKYSRFLIVAYDDERWDAILDACAEEELLNLHRSPFGGRCAEYFSEEPYILKSFELAIKTGESRGLMTSFNRIGTRWTGGDYRLVTNI